MAALKAGTLSAANTTLLWHLIGSKADFEALANNSASQELLSGSLLVLAEAGYTLNQGEAAPQAKIKGLTVI